MMLRSFILSIFLTFSLGQLAYAEMLDEGPIVTSEQPSQSAAEALSQEQESLNEEHPVAPEQAMPEAQIQDAQQTEQTLTVVSDQSSEPAAAEMQPTLTEEPVIISEQSDQRTTETPNDQSTTMAPTLDMIVNGDSILRSDQPLQSPSGLFKYHNQLKRALLYGAAFGPWVPLILSVVRGPNARSVYRTTNMYSVVVASYFILEGLDIREKYRAGRLLVSLNPKDISKDRKILNFAKEVSLYMSLLISLPDVLRRGLKKLDNTFIIGIKQPGKSAAIGIKKLDETVYWFPGFTTTLDPQIAKIGLVGIGASLVHLCLLGGEKLYDWYQARAQAVALKVSSGNQPSPAN